MTKRHSQHEEDIIDETLDDSFPASDPPSFSPVAYKDPTLRMYGSLARVEPSISSSQWKWWAAGGIVAALAIGWYISAHQDD